MAHSEDFQNIAENLGFLEDWEDRYRYLIELGQAMPPLGDAERVPANKVHGCASQVWLVTEPGRDDSGPVLRFRGDSDAMIVKGLVAILVALYSGMTPEEAARTDAVQLFDEIGLREHLTTQRANGLASMVARIRSEAQEQIA